MYCKMKTPKKKIVLCIFMCPPTGVVVAVSHVCLSIELPFTFSSEAHTT